MKTFRLFALFTVVLLCLATRIVFAQDTTPQPSAARPPLVACTDGEKVPCVQNVSDIGAIVGVWRSYIRDSSGIHFGFTVYKDDGSVALSTNSQAESSVIGSISFENEIATLTTNSDGLAASNCVPPGSYQIRLIRMGDQPVALTYHPTSVETPDICFGRVGGFVQPMLYYPGTGQDLSDLDANTDALTQPLVPCLSLPRPCDVIATKLEDIKGLWKSYFSPVPQGFGFGRFDESGGQMMVGAGNDLTALKEFFPVPYSQNFNGALFFDGAPDATDPCAKGVDYLRVIKFGTQRVALQWTAVQDACPPRKVDFSDALIWIKSL